MPYASLNGVRLYYEERGSGTPILGIHGAGSSAVFWEDAAERLSELGRVIIYDRRGSNRSERPVPYDTTSVGEHADDALALLRELAAEPAILIGRSYGGTVALDVALRQPDSVRGIALLEAGPLGLAPEYDAWFERIRRIAEEAEPARVGEAVMREVFGTWEELPDEWRAVFTVNGQALLAELRGEERTANDRFGELRVPILVLTADDSPEPIRRASENLARALPDARSTRVRGGHAIDPAGDDVLMFVSEILELPERRLAQMADERELLRRTADIAADFLETLDERPIPAVATVDELRKALGGRLAETPRDPIDVIEALSSAAEPGVVGIPSGRYFGFVIGGAFPAALAADWLTSAWDQNAGLVVAGPSAAVVEEVAGEWLKDLLCIPATASFSFVTGCQMAHVTCLAAARHAVLERESWDVESDGLAGAPSITVVTGGKRHVTIDRALRLLGLGSKNTIRVEVDSQARMTIAALEKTLRDVDGPAIVCAQAGEVNTGAFDPLQEIAEVCRAADVWLHVDGAFGLWAAASPALRHLTEGSELADSWATDAHKWLNVPYDSGLAFVAHPEAHRAAMRLTAEYLVADPNAARDQMDWTPEFSRRARGFAVYAALRSLGRSGVADLVDGSCSRARQFAAAIVRLPGCSVVNDVVLNQVLFRFADDETTSAVLAHVQRSGEAWMSGTVWDGRPAIRLSVSNWRTTENDVDRTIAAFEAAIASV